MIKVTSKYNISGFNAIRNELDKDNFAKLTVRVGTKMMDVTRQTLLTQLQTEPGPVVKPIDWTSERQRKAYFATNGFGAGIPYRRTGRLAKSWTVDTKVEAGKFQAVVKNSAPQAQFIYGTLNMRSLAEAMIPQQQFHRNTGWLTARTPIKNWTEMARTEAERAFANEAQQLKVRIQRRSRRK